MHVEVAWWWVDFVLAWWILFPAYAANMFPPLARGRRPIDCGRSMADGRRIFGDGKTWEGLGLGLVAGTLVGALETHVQGPLNAYATQFGMQLPAMSLLTGFAIAAGALGGDLTSSFFKRRVGLQRGADVPLLDQLNFVVGAFAAAALLTRVSWGMFGFALLVTPLIHRAANIVGYRIKLKKVPW